MGRNSFAFSLTEECSIVSLLLSVVYKKGKMIDEDDFFRSQPKLFIQPA